MSKLQEKRNLFAELAEGVDEINSYRKTKKITLRAYKVEKKPHLKVTATLIRHTRQQLHMSRSVFALKLRVSPRTLEKWEQGETKPNDQAAALILMVNKFPDTLKRLEEI